ncbi:hypothetical protein [Streptomyces oceani]|uniref:Uncharacterized protein n=1 Tax=Streptomyces oceani TaxID=1075402 RepID=A0A1E7KNG3_9ACTN|nr:hypothetical protein [Streptomyces oceani]OEV05450.1 hypothetical protein AN216_03015 [Streptomyces oceani]
MIADAWLSNVEALAQAASRNAPACEGALSAASRAVERIGTEAPPWPWVFTFSEAKVATNRAACGERLGLPKWAGSESLVGLVEQLLAVWDGQPSRGYGGTAEVVAYARRMGVPVTVLWPEGATRD